MKSSNYLKKLIRVIRQMKNIHREYGVLPIIKYIPEGKIVMVSFRYEAQ